MKTIRYIFLMLAAATFVTACNDELNPNDINKGNPGDEVQFGAALPGGTKTIYGDEIAEGFPIYWVNGDKVRVASPQCQSGRNNAEYSISVNGAGQNYATSMTKTGEYGVQWGNTETSDFYSVYPAGSAALEISGNDVKASLSIAKAQTAKPKTNNAEDLVFEPEDMSNVVMIAKEKDVPTTGDVVNLKYIPFSTVIEFTIPGPTSDDPGALMEIIVQSLTLTAPEGTKIAGDFDFNLGALSSTSTSTSGIPDLKAENVSNASNSILLHILDRNNAYAKVTKGKTLKVKMCLVPQTYTSLEGWKVTVSTNEGDYVKTIKSDELNSDQEKNKLKSGLVHKVTLPALNYQGKWKYEPGNWITSLPDYTNIYLSELSLPGAWYAGSTEVYQATNDIPTLWKAGVRAFAVECRSYTPRSGFLGLGNLTNSSPTRIALSGTGTEKNGAYTTPELGSCTYLSSIISSVAGSIKADEYGVLVLSYADGGSGGHRTLDYQYFINGIANEITRSGATNIYSGEKLDKNTTVKDVLGKLIIKVNVDKRILIGSYGSDQNYLISYNPFLLQISTDAANFAHPYYSDLHWKFWSDDCKNVTQLSDQNIPNAGAENEFIWVFSSANRTQANNGTNTTIPTYKNRQDALGAMMTFSKTVYDRSNHNVWFYFNCGGTQATSSTSSGPSPTAFASTMNSWLLETINAKTDPSPLGIVMFNQCTSDTYNGPAIIKAIIEMNSKFYLKHAGTSGGSTGGSTSGNEVPNDAVLANGGEAI